MTFQVSRCGNRNLIYIMTLAIITAIWSISHPEVLVCLLHDTYHYVSVAELALFHYQIGHLAINKIPLSL